MQSRFTFAAQKNVFLTTWAKLFQA